MIQQPAFAQNPDELFDVVDHEGRPLGFQKRRADVHRDGDWHQAIHVWVVGQNANGTFIICQRRSFQKDTWPGEFDVTVGGHIGAGENADQALREMEEEIGVVPDSRLLTFAGRRMSVFEEPGSYLDRELQQVFLYRDDRELTGYQPNPFELDGLCRLPLNPLLELLTGNRAKVEAEYLNSSTGTVTQTAMALSDFQLTWDRYFLRVCIAARNHLRGDTWISV